MTDASYAQLLDDLRRDLQLNPSTDLLPFALASAQNLPWHIDAGTVTFAFTASGVSAPQIVPHRLGHTPIAVLLQNGGSVGFDSIVTAIAAASFTAESYTTAGNNVTTNVGFFWVAIG